MKRILIGLSSLVLAMLLFTGGIFASQWLNLSFTGDDAIEQADSGVDRIMKILRDVNKGKISAEEAVALLEDEKASLETSNTALQARIDELEEKINGGGGGAPGLLKKIEELEAELATANSTIEGLRAELAIANTNLASVTQERDSLQSNLTNITQERDNLKLNLDNAEDYIAHLETELERANTKVNSHADKVSEAVKEAESYVSEDKE